MAAPVIKAEKSTTPQGQEQVFQFYTVVDAVDEAGQPVKVRQNITRTTIGQLTVQSTRALELIALAQALG